MSNTPEIGCCAHIAVKWTTESLPDNSTRGWWECRDCKATFAPTAALNAEVERLQSEVRALEESTEALEQKLKALSVHQTCGCSYDRKDDVCLHHSPRLVAAESELQELDRVLKDEQCENEMLTAALKDERECFEVKLAGENTRAKMLLEAKDRWAERARKAESALKEYARVENWWRDYEETKFCLWVANGNGFDLAQSVLGVGRKE